MPSQDVNINREIFIKKCQEKYNNNFSYPYIDKEYKNSHSKLTIVCKKCGTTFTKIANDHWSSSFGGCPVCKDERFKEKRSFTYEELKKVFDKVNLLPFEGKKDKYADSVEISCPKHGIYVQKMIYMKNEADCPLCRKAHGGTLHRYSKEFAEERIKQLCGNNLEYDITGYIDTTTKLTFKCKKCGYIFNRDLNSFTYNQNCPNCTKAEQSIKRTRKQEDFIAECKSIYGDLYDYSETVYKKRMEKITVKCNRCGKYFTIAAGSHLQGHGCPYHYCHSSKAEEEIRSFLKEYIPSSDFYNNYRGNKEIKELDIYIPSKNVGIEYDGIFWHSEGGGNKGERFYHINKTLNCEKHGISLIHIFEDEWKNKKEIVKSLILYNLNLSPNIVNVNECIIKEINKEDEKKFLEGNYLFDKPKTYKNISLIKNQEAISSIVYKIGKCGECEILAFCNKKNTFIKDGFKTLINILIESFSLSKITFKLDRRYFNGKEFQDLNFKIYRIEKPKYSYTIGEKRVNKDLVEKKEKDNYEKVLKYKIYDCGQIFLKKEIKNLKN